MVEKHIKAYKDYVKGMKYKALAEKYGVSVNTIKSWKQRHGWQRKKGAPSKKSVHTKKVGAPLGNKNALGNKGGAPQRNQNAVTHGFFSKFLPKDTLSIMEEIQERSPVDMIWDQIQIQYAAIIRAQKIMFVSDKEEMIKELKKKKTVLSETNEVEEEEFEFQFSWDRHATFLNAQSRAMAELRNLIKQFDELANSEDERRLKLEHMRLNINKKKLEVEELTEEDKPFEITIVNKGDDSD
ncbi:phage terminase small subunit [Bacillus inaquosorum]|uniref:phage terminase small subunit n=1 Tax=Bacillus subtilis group TaxID=653685 RepID=UPI0005C98830|nr:MULTISPECIES: phage terminase small subunit [Bacillus subtilis group]MCY8420117.1 phage terminase small subunit [Bacillus inaquosorum]MCY8783175.1 phage terminase small subunit [Bacillus spizizenii]MCY9120535.1 phage terminase small subunit [Bacillus spizizenii]MEC0978934.1 phage terminase small subunit [Bacillus inaquosorum]